MKPLSKRDNTHAAIAAFITVKYEDYYYYFGRKIDGGDFFNV